MKFQQLQNATPSQLIEAFKTYASNQKKNDRHAIGYKIGMIDPHAGTLAIYSDMKRADLLRMLFDRINEKTIFRLIQSEHTANELAKLIPSTSPAPAITELQKIAHLLSERYPYAGLQSLPEW